MSREGHGLRADERKEAIGVDNVDDNKPVFYVSYNKKTRDVKSGQCEVGVVPNKGDAPMYSVCPEKNVGFVGRRLDVLATIHSRENSFYTFGESIEAAKTKLIAWLNIVVSDKEKELQEATYMRDDVSALPV